MARPILLAPTVTLMFDIANPAAHYVLEKLKHCALDWIMYPVYL